MSKAICVNNDPQGHPTGIFVGTEAQRFLGLECLVVFYMSPEEARGSAEVDHRSDIFSLGAILWFMVTGSTPGELPSGTSSAPRPLRAICERAMAADPAARYRSAGEMATDIARYLTGAPVLAYPEGLLERVGRILLAIDFLAMADANDENDQAVAFDLADEPVIAYTVFPELSKPRAVQRLSNAARIV